MNNNSNITLNELEQKLTIQNSEKKDLLVKSNRITMMGGLLNIHGEQQDYVCEPTLPCHGQIATKLEIPSRYYQKMVEQDKLLLDQNVNAWLSKQKNAKYFIRTFKKKGANGVARALLSDSYKVIDNLDVLYAALDAIRTFAQKEGVRVEIESSALSDKKMYIRVTAPDIEIEAKNLLKEYRSPSGGVGHGIISGLVLTNSETGHGTFSVSPRAIVLACRNGLMRPNDAFKKRHLGARLESEGDNIIWSKETESRNLELIISQVKDAVKTYLSKDYLGKLVDEMTEQGEARLEHPIDAVHNVCKAYGYSDERKTAVLDFFVRGADTRRIGIVQALTYEAHETGNADDAYEAEIIASEVLPTLGKFDKKFKAELN